MTHSNRRRAAGKVPDGFPLWVHPSGRWCKKVRARAHYFGKVADDPEGAAALDEWLRVKDDLLAGRRPRPKGSEGLTVGKLCNLYLATQAARVEVGALAPRTGQTRRLVTDRLVGFFGPGRLVEDIRPDDFEALLRALPKTWGMAAKSTFIVVARSVFNYAAAPDQRLISQSVPFGLAFRPASKREWRRHRAENGERLFTAEQLRLAIAAAGAPFRAALLLGINCAFGNSDVAQLPWSAVRGEWLDFPRPKTGEPRRAWLWPETREALEVVHVQGRRPANPADAWRVFLTREGRPWVRLVGSAWSDSICTTTRELFKRLGIIGRSFYDLRRTFRTVADEVPDTPVINLIMGHSDPSMGAVYRQRIDDGRIRRVCEHVRQWLYSPPKGIGFIGRRRSLRAILAHPRGCRA